MRDCVKPSPDLALIAKLIGDNHYYKRKGKAEENKHKPQAYGGKGHGGTPAFAPVCHLNDKANQGFQQRAFGHMLGAGEATPATTSAPRWGVGGVYRTQLAKTKTKSKTCGKICPSFSLFRCSAADVGRNVGRTGKAEIMQQNQR
jgi:hypothetical protein